MDQLFVELVGKPQLNPAKIITIVADNFSFVEDQAKFLKATLAIPAVKQLPLENVNKRLIQIGPLHCELEDLLENKDKHWIINKYQSGAFTNLLESIEKDFSSNLNGSRSLIYVNDASKLLISTRDAAESQKRFLRLIDSWKRSQNNFVVILFQQSAPTPSETFLRDLEYISDASVHCKLYKSCYLQSVWFQPTPLNKTLILPKVETHYYTCRVGRSYWSSELLCFYERVRVSKDFDPSSCDASRSTMAKEETDKKPADEEISPVRAIEKIALESDEEGDADTASKTLPYIRAQNPEQSKIFYYPDKDDDIDEDDPDNDLDF